MMRRMMLRSTAEAVPNPFADVNVALSLRDLGLGSTHVVRVRRDSDNAQQDFRSTEILNGALTSFCGTGNGFVSIWYDQAGINNAIQNVAINQPQIVRNGNLILNSSNLPSLDFTQNTGSTKFLEINPFHTSTTVNVTIFCIYEIISLTLRANLLFTNLAGNGFIIERNNNIPRIFVRYANNINFFFDDPPALNINQLYLRILNKNQINFTSIINNETPESQSDNTNPIMVPNKYLIGGRGDNNNTSEHMISEMLFYNTQIDINNVQFNINNFYNIY